MGPGRGVRVGGYQIADGMIYVGQGLEAAHSVRWGRRLDPALIDPTLDVERSRPDRAGDRMGYWPSYDQISPASRAAYLEWLAGGRKDPDAYIGSVFLFFYGLERRLLVDARALAVSDGEVRRLMEEVERLLELYGHNGSFRGYASRFLEFVRLERDPAALDEWIARPPAKASDHLLALSLVAARAARDKEPLPVEWAWIWTKERGLATRTPARRCPEELEELFRMRYPQLRGGGVKIRPSKKPLEMIYQPASSGIASRSISWKETDLTETLHLEAPARRLSEFADQLCQELDPFSRWVGRTDDRDSPAALALLPTDLAVERTSPAGQALVEWVESRFDSDGWARVETAELIERWPDRKNSDKLTKREVVQLVDFLELRGFGLEPDVRHGGRNLSSAETAVMFRLADEGPAEPGEAYAGATLLLHLAAAVSTADGEVSTAEERLLAEHLEEALELNPSERLRLRAHLDWLLADPPGFAGVKKRLEALDAEARDGAGQFLLTVAGADGQVTAEELKMLRKIYPLLGLAPDDVFTHVHAMRSGGEPRDEPVTVVPGSERKGYSIPSPSAESAEDDGVIRLDREAIRRQREQTARTSELLAEVFEDAEELAPPAPAAGEWTSVDAIAGLDGPHSELLRRLGEHPEWSRDDVEHLAGTLELMTDGALETINLAALDRVGDPVIEGVGDGIYVDLEIYQEMSE